MTVSSDVEKVHRRLTEILGNEDMADGWMDVGQEQWEGKSAYELVERGRTEEVLEHIAHLVLSG